MIPKEKAKELINKFNTIDAFLIDAKQCALITIDEIINLLPNINLIAPIHRKSDEFYFQYWQEVKQEVKKL